MKSKIIGLFALGMLGLPLTALAMPMTLTFAGTVYGATDTSLDGQTVSGSLTFDPSLLTTIVSGTGYNDQSLTTYFPATPPAIGNILFSGGTTLSVGNGNFSNLGYIDVNQNYAGGANEYLVSGESVNTGGDGATFSLYVADGLG